MAKTTDWATSDYAGSMPVFCVMENKIKNGLIFLGMTLTNLKELLGTPDEYGGVSRKYKQPCVFKYKNIEFGFTPAKHKYEEQYLSYVMTEEHEFLLRRNNDNCN